MTEKALAAERLVKRYRGKQFGTVLALDGFSLTVDPGEIVGLVGANGSGKTTFVETVVGLIRPDHGTVRVLGIDMLRSARAARSRLGFAPQESAMYVSATVLENLHVFGGLAGLRRAALRAAVTEVSEQMQLGALLDRPVGWLSGGQRRRTQVATALLGRPELLLLDDPTAGADPPTRQALLTAVRARAAEGAAIVYTTHYLPELAELGATLAVVKGGRVIARGTQDELLAGLPGELRVAFDGPVPDRLRTQGRLDGQELCLPSLDPGQALAGILADGHVPMSVDVRRPSLDDLYRSLDEVPAHAI
jgi:ABC-2 type transport system ATP-binding protein